MAGSYHTPNRSYPLGIFLEYSDTLPTYGIIFSNFASKNILATCEPHAGKYSRYMLRVSKLNIAEHDGVWHHSFCTCLYRAGTDASFFFAMEAPSHTASYATYPQTTSNNIENHSWGNPSKYHYTWFSPGLVPNLFIFHPISSMFFSCPSKELPIPMALRGRGKTG